ncbi:MAG: hypothetical protein MRY49_00685 [Candidatus Pacebacteria bacterium]|nr:hypothetical protein [Candidatus Paceibacterota bacterium]
MTKFISQLHKEKIMFWLLAITIVSSFIAYMFLVNSTVLNIVKREEVGNSLATLNTKVSELEFEYITLKNSIDIEYALDRGYVPAENITFAGKKDTNLSLNR